jgi:hypothetical protein
MVEHMLSADILSNASLRGNEYAWAPAHVEAAINDARQRGLETSGGQAQFRLPDGTCELYWINIDPSKRKLDESWNRWVDRSANEAIEKFRQCMAQTDWKLEIQNWTFLREKAESHVDVMSHLCFVLYFGKNPLGQMETA